MKLARSINSPISAATCVGVSLILGLLFNWLFFGKFPGISFVIYIAAIICGLVILTYRSGRSLPVAIFWLLLPLGFFSVMVALRASRLLIVLNILASLLLLLLVARIAFRDNLRGLKLIDYAKIPFLPLKFFAPLVRTLADVFALRSVVSKHPLAAQITRGIALTIPLLAVFLLLFASADLVFQKYVIDTFNVKLDVITVWRTILVALVTLVFTGAYTYTIKPSDKQSREAKPAARLFSLGKVEISILLGSISVLFLLFILIQLAYLFGGQSNISAQGFTYAQYARKGFFELLVAAILAFAMLWTVDKTVAKTAGGHSLAFRILSSALIIEVILIMVSAFKRLYLYEQAFGFTTLRLYSHSFVIFLAAIFVLLLIKILKNQSENHFAFPAFIMAITFLVGMNLLNPDAFIARQNLDRLHQTGKLDAAYMSELSEDALPQIKTAINLTTGDTHRQLVDALKKRSVPLDWRSWNLSRNQASR